jgi:co-chaperonin GroES (HSP10)
MKQTGRMLNMSGIILPNDLKNEPVTLGVTSEGFNSYQEITSNSVNKNGYHVYKSNDGFEINESAIGKGKLSFIENCEEEEAKKIIEEHLGFPAPRVTGYHLAVKIYVREQDVHSFIDDKGEKKFIALPDSVTANDKFRNCTALVVSVGAGAYKGERFAETGPWCKVGDWVVIPRNEGTQVNYRGIPMQLIPDDRILCVIEDPSHVTRD